MAAEGQNWCCVLSTRALQKPASVEQQSFLPAFLPCKGRHCTPPRRRWRACRVSPPPRRRPKRCCSVGRGPGTRRERCHQPGRCLEPSRCTRPARVGHNLGHGLRWLGVSEGLVSGEYCAGAPDNCNATLLGLSRTSPIRSDFLALTLQMPPTQLALPTGPQTHESVHAALYVQYGCSEL